jgi:hypothetical protein
MNKLIWLTMMGALAGSAYAQNSKPTAPEWKATVKVIDEENQPVTNANVKVWYHISPPRGQSIAMTNKTGVTDPSGVFTASEHSTSVELAFEAQKSGYYSAGRSYYLGFTDQYDPARWSPSITMVLKRIGRPIPMYAKRVETKVAKENESVAFDLMVGDWLAPFGSGKNADLFFAVRRVILGDRQYDAEVKLTFPNKGDGIVVAAYQPDTGSELKTPRLAAEDGYQPERVWHYSNSAAPESVYGYLFRVRTVMDEKGDVRSALYGKIRGDIRFYAGTKAPHAGLGFDYYLNPTANDRNLEFDPKQNLLKGLKSTEQVDAP